MTEQSCNAGQRVRRAGRGVERHQGMLTIKSEENKVTYVTISLPSTDDT